MKDVALAWSAIRNLTTAVRRDPVWAIGAALLSPVRLIRHLFATAVILIIVAVALGLAAQLIPPHWTVARSLADGSVLLILAAITLRQLTQPLVTHFGTMSGDTHGSARFASKTEIMPLTRDPSGLLIGRDPTSGRLLRYDGPAHLLTMAPTRSGKGVGTLLPNLLTADRSILCIDPKGENAMVTGRTRERFGPVHVLDPFGVTGRPSSAFNPLDALDPNSLDVAEEAGTLAEALVVDDPGTGGEAHWNEEATALITGLLLRIATEEPTARRHLGTLREDLTLAPDDFADLLTRMQRSDAAGGLVARAANRQRGKAEREAASVLSVAQRHTHFLDSPRMTAVLGRSDFEFASLKHHTATVFLVLPPDRLATYARWLRLLTAQSLTAMARDPSRPAAPVLYLLDEFAALGHLAPVERAMGLMAGYGVQLWPILQDIHQLRATYGQRAGTFLANAGVLQVFGTTDHDSARLVSDLLGQGTVVFETAARSLDAPGSGLSLSRQHVARPLLTPDEVRAMPADTQLLFLAGQRPIVATKLAYHADPEFRGLFDAG